SSRDVALCPVIEGPPSVASYLPIGSHCLDVDAPCCLGRISRAQGRFLGTVDLDQRQRLAYGRDARRHVRGESEAEISAACGETGLDELEQPPELPPVLCRQRQAGSGQQRRAS